MEQASLMGGVALDALSFGEDGRTPVAVKAPCAARLCHLNNWFGPTQCRRATRLTVAPGWLVSSTMRILSAALQGRRRCTEVITSVFGE